MNDVIIFLHIPKTAGTTFNQILEREYNNIHSLYLEKEDIDAYIKEWSSDLIKDLFPLYREYSLRKIETVNIVDTIKIKKLIEYVSYYGFKKLIRKISEKLVNE